MGVVYAATHRNQKKVAVKVLHPEQSQRGDVRTRFLREGYAANAVEHEGVVAILDDDVDDGSGSAFLVMELLHGLDVRAWAARCGGRLPLHAALNVTHQLLEVLAAAHAKGIVHRDIKPANLLVQFSGRLKVLDFGIARVEVGSGDHEATRSGAVLGTPAFMAPELASGQRAEVDARTDLWAVGASLFSLLSGEQVHVGEHANQVLIRAATTHARSLRCACPELPSHVAELVDRALSFEKAARFQSAAEMAASVLRAHEQECGALRIESLQSLLAEAAARPDPESETRAASSAASAGLGPTVSALGELSVAAESPRGRTRSLGSEPLFSPNPARVRRRMASLLGVAAALLGLGLAFDRYVSRTPAEAKAPEARAMQVQPALRSTAADLALPLERQVNFPSTPTAEAPVNPPPVIARAVPSPVAAGVRGATVRRASVTGREPALPPARIAKNPLDIELQ